MKEDLRRFLDLWGQRFVQAMKAELAKAYAYAPGSKGSQPNLSVGDAYGEKGQSGDNWIARNTRNSQYSGSGSKSPAGSALYESISGEVFDDGFQIMMANYWEYVNYGRQRGFYVPLSPLEAWAKLKGFDDPRGAAFAINRNIYKFGIAPTFFYENALDSIITKFDKDLGERMGKSVEDFLDNILEIQN